MLLNCTKRAQVDKVWPKLFEIAPTAQRMIELELSELETVLKSLGFWRKRAISLKAMSSAFLEGKRGIELPGIGIYGDQSDRIFFLDQLPDVQDHALKSYVEWKKQQSE